MWQMIGVLAELERSLISEWTRAGVAAALSRGLEFGRKPKLTAQQIDANIRRVLWERQNRRGHTQGASEWPELNALH